MTHQTLEPVGDGGRGIDKLNRFSVTLFYLISSWNSSSRRRNVLLVGEGERDERERERGREGEEREGREGESEGREKERERKEGKERGRGGRRGRLKSMHTKHIHIE